MKHTIQGLSSSQPLGLTGQLERECTLRLLRECQNIIGDEGFDLICRQVFLSMGRPTTKEVRGALDIYFTIMRSIGTKEFSCLDAPYDEDYD